MIYNKLRTVAVLHNEGVLAFGKIERACMRAIAALTCGSPSEAPSCSRLRGQTRLDCSYLCNRTPVSSNIHSEKLPGYLLDIQQLVCECRSFHPDYLFTVPTTETNMKWVIIVIVLIFLKVVTGCVTPTPAIWQSSENSGWTNVHDGNGWSLFYCTSENQPICRRAQMVDETGSVLSIDHQQPRLRPQQGVK